MQNNWIHHKYGLLLAVLALMESGSSQAVDVLKEMLNDEDFEVRMYAKEALKRNQIFFIN